MNIPLSGGSAGYLDSQFDAQKTVNMYCDVIPGTKELALIAIPGSKLVYTHFEGSAVRQQFADRDDLSLFVVYEDKVVKHDSSLNPVTLGTLNTTAGYIGIDSNNSQQITFVDGVDGWVYDYSGMSPTFTQITSPGFPGSPVDVSFLDGHMLVAAGGTNQWFISDIDDATSYNALNYAELTSDEEKIVGIRVVDRRIFVFGRYITEVFYNSQNASSFPFVRDNNQVIQFGCASRGSIAQAGDILVWVASQRDGGPSVRMTYGGPAIPISDKAVETSLQSYQNLSATVGYIYKINGHTFYCMNNPEDNKTWVYDFSMNRWHNQEMIDGSYYFGTTHAVYRGTHYLGSSTAPKLYELNPDYTTNEGQNIHCLRITAPVIHPKLQRLRQNRMEVQGFMGRGAATTQLTSTNRYDTFELDTKLYLSVSTDYGKTFSSPFVQSMGKVGEFNYQTVYTQLGVGKSFVYKLETFHAARTAFLRADGLFEEAGY